ERPRGEVGLLILIPVAALAGTHIEDDLVLVGLHADIVAACFMLGKPDGGARSLWGEEGGLIETGPKRFAFGGEGFDGVEVGAELEPSRISQAESVPFGSRSLLFDAGSKLGSYPLEERPDGHNAPLRSTLGP